MYGNPIYRLKFLYYTFPKDLLFHLEETRDKINKILDFLNLEYQNKEENKTITQDKKQTELTRLQNLQNYIKQESMKEL